MKTLKQRFKQWETVSYTDQPNNIPTLIALDETKQWLQEILRIHQQQKTLQYPLYYHYKETILKELIKELTEETQK